MTAMTSVVDHPSTVMAIQTWWQDLSHRSSPHHCPSIGAKLSLHTTHSSASQTRTMLQSSRLQSAISDGWLGPLKRNMTSDATHSHCTRCPCKQALNEHIPSQHHSWLGITTWKTPKWRPKPDCLVNAHVTINQNHKSKGTLILTLNEEVCWPNHCRNRITPWTHSSATESWSLYWISRLQTIIKGGNQQVTYNHQG